MKILLCGDINSGKSTLIQKLVSDIGKAPRGYITVRMPEDETGISHVYLYDISSPPERIEDAIVIMEIRGDKFDRRPEYMSSIAAPILEGIPEGSLVVLDELGTLEEHEERFKNAVMRILSGPVRSGLGQGAEHRFSARYPAASRLRALHYNARKPERIVCPAKA